MSKDSATEHREKAAVMGQVAFAIVTVSDSRTLETDVNHHYLQQQITANGHRVAAYHLIKDEPEQVAGVLDDLCATDAQIILFNGGTGISPRDTTYDALSGKLEKVLPGFGELFRMLSWDQVGAAAMLSRATAGVYRGRMVFSTPGSPKAVALAWEKLIMPEISHLAWELVR